VERVLVIHPHLDRFGGSERLTRILVGELRRKGLDVAVLTSVRDERWFPNNYARYYWLSPGNCGKSRQLSVVASISDAVSDFSPDSVVVMIQEPVYALATKLVDPRLPVALYIHFPIEEELTRENLARFMEIYRFPNMYNQFYSAVDALMTNSYRTASITLRLHWAEPAVVYPAIEWSFILSPGNPEAPRRNRIVSIGRFVPHKRFIELIQMFKEVKRVISDAELYIIGTRDDRHPTYVEEVKAAAEGVKDVHVLDRFMRDEEMIEVLREAKAYAHLRLGEHFGMAPVEAMTQGVVPVIHSDSGLAEVTTHMVDAVHASSDEEFLKALKSLLTMPEVDRVRIARRGVETAKRFNPDSFTRRVLGHLAVARARVESHLRSAGLA